MHPGGGDTREGDEVPRRQLSGLLVQVKGDQLIGSAHVAEPAGEFGVGAGDVDADRVGGTVDRPLAVVEVDEPGQFAPVPAARARA